MIGRIPILDVQPVVRVATELGANAPAKAVPEERFMVSATVFREGHEMLGAGVVLTDPAGQRQPIEAMHELAEGTDRFGAEVMATREGLWHFAIEAWGDPVARWRHDAEIKVPIGQDVELMLTEGALLLERGAAQIHPARTLPAADARRARTARTTLTAAAGLLRDAELPPLERLAAALTPAVITAQAAFPLRDLLTTSENYPLIVHRQRALFSAWYEFFPRSEGAVLDPTHRRKPQSGTFRTAARRLDAIADMGFDVVYLPRCTRSAPQPARARTTRSWPALAIPARPGLSDRRPADMMPFTRISGRSRTSTPLSPGPATSASKWRWTSRCRPRPITRG